ncbi:MAG: DUF2341 domain-containing protein [Candidatus Aureabacteria bacterium]|nr:DUF2341 domain-containing protein [Candidatus Auribacterota bacterium]
MRATLVASVIVIGAAALCGMVVAGSIDAPGAPSLGSGMYTLQNLYDYLVNGSALTVQSGFQEPGAAPGSTMKTTRELGDAIKALHDQCDATAYNVELGKKFFCTQPGSWGVQTGRVCIAGTPTPTPTITPTSTPIWLSGWGYRKPITVSNSGSALTDYQVLITMNTQELIPAKMRSDGADVRFADSDKVTLINCWIKSGIGTDSTKIWVKVPSVPAGSKTIYIYYGKSNAESVSDSSAFLNNGLVGYWNLNEGSGLTSADASATNNSLTINTAGWTNSGKLNKAIYTTGVSGQYAYANNNNAYDFTQSGKLTISLWINFLTLNTGSSTSIIGKYGNGMSNNDTTYAL